MANPLPPTKTGSVASQPPSASQPQLPVSPGDGHARRPGGSGSFGAGSTTRPLSSARKDQTMRKQHKGRRPKLAEEDTAAESAAMRATGSRKGQTSITHLMNFTLPPRPMNHNQFNNGRHANGHGRRNPTWGLGSGYHAVDKARYVHANYRFIVDPREDYRPQTIDADVHLEWRNVLQILASAQSQEASCPICLSTPVAPRMAKCGHIFCLPCLIRYMHSSDDSKAVPEKKSRWKKCPICWDSVYLAETKPVRWFQGQESLPPREGGDVVLRLMMRNPGSILALPREEAENPSATGDIPWFFAAEVMDYARIMKGSEDYMQTSFDREIDEVRIQEKEDELMFGEETQWARKAISTIMDLKERSKGIGNPPATPKKPEERMPKRTPIQFSNDVPEFYAVLSAAKSGQSLAAPKQATETHSGSSDSQTSPIIGSTDPFSTIQPIAPQSSNSRASDSPFFFYQALLHYYLSPLDIRILRAAFGDYHSFPTTILPRVERVSTGHIVDDDLRKRAKYLGHLPQGCEVSFLECDWTDVVAPSILAHFTNEIERRRKKNKEKETREEKERIRAEKEEDDKRWAAARRKRPSLSKDRETSPIQLPGNDRFDSDEHITMSASADSSSLLHFNSLPKRTGSAFASLASPSTSPNAPRTVWGTAAVASSSPQIQAVYHEDTSENDGWLQNWEQDLLKEDDQLVAQIQALTTTGGSSSNAATPASTGKKKKNKKITLMSTNARRAA